MQWARRVTPLRAAVTSLAVVLGILSMHALSGGPHTPRGVEHVMTDATAGTGSLVDGPMAAMSAMAAGLDALEAAAGTTLTLAGALPALVDAAPDPPPPDPAMAAMCAAVLLAVAVAVGFRLARRSPPRPALTYVSRAVRGSGRAPRARPPDLLTVLCVMRT